MSPKAPPPGTIASNRKARHDYHIEETYEAGLSLRGSEVKTLRQGKASLQESYAVVRGNEAFLIGANIPPYAQASILNHEPTRTRKLLLHKQEIRRLLERTHERGFTLVPLRLYFKGNKVKCEIALARGKRAYDKREAIARRDAEREIAKRLGRRRRGER
ncbi:MAG: SsrA-binding protein SmpB [Acidobacteria bacterium]|nr:SsrA-binding protein SmpB [Acidobacteriota bacterium]